MARRIRLIRLNMSNGESTVIQVKTTTENYIRKVIADMILPAKVMTYEFIG